MSSENTTEDFEGFESEDSSSSWEDVDENEIVDEAICHPLLMNSLILEKIFDFLPTRDLLQCRRVCKEWNKTALLRKVLGSKFKVTISKANFDRLLKTAQNSSQPFCRKFEFRLLELEYDKVSKFIRLFGERLNRLSIKFCTASLPESVIKILNCPRLEELKIYGALPVINEENFHTFAFSRLRVVSLNSSLDYGQVDPAFIKILIKHAPNISTVKIGQSISLWRDFCRVIPPVNDSRICQVSLSGIEAPLEIEHFQDFFSKHLILHKISFENCLIRQIFLEQLLQLSSRHVSVLKIDGTQQEILSTVFREISLPNLKQITLPIYGISITDGGYLLQSCSTLKRLKIVGLFKTHFAFDDGRLISVIMKEKNFSHPVSRDNTQQVVFQEKRREFLKVISLIHLQPLKLEINLPLSNINSRCIRAVYAKYPHLEQLSLINSSTKECLVGLTGIPYRLCKRIAHCKSFAILYPDQVRVLVSTKILRVLKRLEITILGDVPTAEITLLFIAYGICELTSLEELSLKNVKISDVALMILAQKLKLSHCKINGSEDRWIQFQSAFKKHSIKSFLLPPPIDPDIPSGPAQVVGRDSKVLKKIFSHLDSKDVFEARKVCNYWRSFTSEYLHQRCSSDEDLISNLQRRLHHFQKDKSCPPSPSNRSPHYLGETLRDTRSFSRILNVWSLMKKQTTLAVVSLERSALQFFQDDHLQPSGKKTISCQKRRQLEYWYYPDGTDNLVYCERPLRSDASLNDVLHNVDALLIIGSWGRKDNGLLEFLNPSWSVSTLHLIGLQKEALDLILPKITIMMNLESLQIRPFVNFSPYFDVTKTHLQILCNSSFKLRQLTLQLHAPSEVVVEFVRSQRFTLETLELHNNVNISDRLTFSMPQLKVLQLDEPPGCLLWTTLNVHSSLETINFGRNGCSYNQVKNKSSQKGDFYDADFEHSATEILCDVNWFLENSPSKRIGVQKSILQQGSDSALKFFMHFPYLTSLTLRSVHAHYKILQGIFKKFTQLKKLTLINATGVTDEILTGFSKEILDEMDIMNPFQVRREPHNAIVQGKNAVSIRNLKCLTHLSLDDQSLCTDFSVIFGILKLHQLEYFSCKKWKITDVALRAIADILPSLKEVNTDGCDTVSKYALDYFYERRARDRRFEE